MIIDQLSFGIALIRWPSHCYAVSVLQISLKKYIERQQWAALTICDQIGSIYKNVKRKIGNCELSANGNLEII